MRNVIAIDFDGCICTDRYPAIGTPNWEVIQAAKHRREEGWALILWSCRTGKFLRDAVVACKKWGLEFDAVNENLRDWCTVYNNDPRKIGATEYWDDKAVVMPGERSSTLPPERLGAQWISVKDRLPEPEQEVLVLVDSNGYEIITTAMYEDGSVSVDDSAWCWYDIDFVYDEETDNAYVPEGWWEYRNYNPDDVYNNKIDDIVTHWMPLPEPPKEDDNDDT